MNRTSCFFRSLFFFCCLLLVASAVQARTKLQGYAERGGQIVLTNGVPSTTSVQGSYPGATVTFYFGGTTTPATIYSDSSGTIKANPFTAGSDASWFAYLDDGTYDIKFSGAGIPTPFTRTGIVVGGGTFTFNPTGFGAKCDGVNDDTSAFTSTWNAAAAAGYAQIVLPAASCVVNAPMPVLNTSKVTVAGPGTTSGRVLFNPVAGGAFITIQPKPADQITNAPAVSGVTIIGTNNQQKTGIKLIAAENGGIFRDLYIDFSNSTNAGNTDYGLDLQGVNLTTFDNIQIWARKGSAVHMGNPTVGQYAGIATGFDHFRFHNLYWDNLGSPRPLVTVDAGVPISNLTISNFAWISGSGGAFVMAGGANGFITRTVFENGRIEQGTGGWKFDIQGTIAGGGGGSSGVTLRNIRATGPHSGVRIRDVTDIVFENDFIYSGPAIADVDLDNTCDKILMINARWGDAIGTRVLGNQLVNWFSASRFITSEINQSGSMMLAYYAKPSAVTIDLDVDYNHDVGVYKKTATMTNGSTLALPNTQAVGFSAIVSVVAYGATKHESGIFAIDGSGTTTLLNGTANVAVGNGAGKLGLQNALLTNNLGETVTVVVNFN